MFFSIKPSSHSFGVDDILSLILKKEEEDKLFSRRVICTYRRPLLLSRSWVLLRSKPQPSKSSSSRKSFATRNTNSDNNSSTMVILTNTKSTTSTSSTSRATKVHNQQSIMVFGWCDDIERLVSCDSLGLQTEWTERPLQQVLLP
jgi:hypothetical protein